jgi:hypothetical protein
MGMPARRNVLLNMAILTAAVPVVHGPANAAEFAPTGAMALLNRKGEYALTHEVRSKPGFVASNAPKRSPQSIAIQQASSCRSGEKS